MSLPAMIKLLAVAPLTSRQMLREKLAPMDAGLICVASASEIGELRRSGEIFEVALLPETMSDLDWWPLWGELSLFTPRPSILVYTRHPTFQLWAAVLDVGGYDVIAEPFGEFEIKSAVANAAQDYRERASGDMP